jgi:hypothetical protein
MESAAAESSLAEQDLDAAISRLQRLLSSAQESGLGYLRWDHAEVSLLLARSLCAAATRAEGEARRALLDQAELQLKSANRLPKRFLYAACLRQRAVVALLRGRPKPALALVDEALSLFARYKGRVEESAALLLRARLRNELGVPGADEDRAHGEALLAAASAWDPSAREGGAWFWT